MKRKCDGKHPCTRCDRRGRDCFYSCKQKSGPPKGSKRKLVEEEEDLLENRASRTINPGWTGCNRTAEVGGTTRSIVQIDSTVSGPETTPSPEARAAAAAAVAASRMTGMASGMNPALAAAGLRPPYMLTPPPVLPGLSASSVPATAPLVTHPQYSTVYQHQYPPEVYAVYLAELRQRGCSPNGVNSNSSTMPAPFAGPVGLGSGQSPAEAAQAAANALAADVAAARNFSPVMSTPRDTPNNGEHELQPGAMNLTEPVLSLADGTVDGGGRDSDDAPVSDDVTPSEVSDTSVKGTTISLNERAKNAAASAAASAALAAAVAAAIAEGSPPDNLKESKPQVLETGVEVGAGDDDKTGQSLATSGAPAKGSRFDVLPKAGLDVTSSASSPAKETLLGRVIKSEEVDHAPNNSDSGVSAPLSGGQAAQELESHGRASPKPVTQVQGRITKGTWFQPEHFFRLPRTLLRARRKRSSGTILPTRAEL